MELQNVCRDMGGGKMGLSLASFLVADGHDVTLIEIDQELYNEA